MEGAVSGEHDNENKGKSDSVRSLRFQPAA